MTPQPGESWWWQENAVGKHPVPIEFVDTEFDVTHGLIPGVFNPRSVEWFTARGEFLCRIPRPDELIAMEHDAQCWRDYMERCRLERIVRAVNAADQSRSLLRDEL